MKNIFNFFILVLVTMSLGLALHIQFNLSEKLFLFQSYSINIIMAMLALLLLDWGIRKKTINLAFIYLLTISIKGSHLSATTLLHVKHLTGISISILYLYYIF